MSHNTSPLQPTRAVEHVISSWPETAPGGIRFTNEIGLEYSRQTLISATTFIWNLFQQNTDADKKNTSKILLFIDHMDGVAYTSNNEIHVSANYIKDYSGDVKKEITGILYHEMTHVWQWNGNGEAVPGGLIEGIADFVRLKAGLAPSHWVEPGQGDRWDQGYDVTARFLDHCDGLKSGFVSELNKKMRNGYSDYFLVELLGKTVDQLWIEYKAHYGVAYCENNEIHVSARYIASYQSDLKKEFNGVMYHEMTHVWQWSGNGSTPQGLIEGIADFVRLKAGYIPSHWVKPGQGEKWDHGYDVTARFLDYCEGVRYGFVGELNKKMRYGFSVDFFVDLVGKRVDQLWSDYKAAYDQQN